ncbi:MAG TPA: GDP-mannose 4,6-dehydratase [Vicinamibacterales bacterium]|nr:GDP-mannose 4,6-dehydratase [Vicinamibacterales bacterium]
MTYEPGSPVLITGASGFAGGHLVEHLTGSHEIIGWARTAPRPELARLADWHTIDLLDRDVVRKAIANLRPSAVFHLAGAPQVAESWRDAAKPLEDNVLATEHLLDAIRRAGLKSRVLVTGSAAVYAPSDSPINEDGAIAPSSPYAVSKLAQEQLAIRTFRDDGLDIIVVRPFNHTGPRQNPAFVAPSMARQIAMIERGLTEPVIRVGNLETRRDFTDVRDVVRAYAALMKLGQSGEIYNVGSGIGRSIRSLLDAFLSRSQVEIRVETDTARLRPSETTVFVAETSRLRARTGWRPQISFESMLDQLLGYWRAEVLGPP